MSLSVGGHAARHQRSYATDRPTARLQFALTLELQLNPGPSLNVTPTDDILVQERAAA
jgi:hypothetical protein